jgi:membrane protein YqaA with SNARE-associated domain
MTVLFTLFFGSFLAATILPFSSEAMLVATLMEGAHPSWLLVTVASAGNILGACINWLIGRYLRHWQTQRLAAGKYFPFSQATTDKATERFNRYGLWSLLFAFLPIVGDPLTFVAGMLRVKFWLFLLLVSIGKIARYIFVAAAVS